MIKHGAVRLVHKPHLKFPWIIQMQRQDDRWIFFESRKTEDEAQKVTKRLEEMENA